MDALSFLDGYASDEEQCDEVVATAEPPLPVTMHSEETVNPSNHCEKDPKLSHLASLPPPSRGPFDVELLEILNQHRDNPNGFDLIKNIVTNKSFGNPSLLKEIVKYFQIDEFGTNFQQ